MKEINELVHKVLSLVLQINQETKLAAFMDFYGHVNSIAVRLSVGKKGEGPYKPVFNSHQIPVEPVWYNWYNQDEAIMQIKENLSELILKLEGYLKGVATATND